GVSGRLRGFKLESFSGSEQSVFLYQDTDPNTQLIYTIIHKDLPVQRVAVLINITSTALSLCEVEVYGDSLCDNQHYGHECESECHCSSNTSCLVNSGWCPNGCDKGYTGKTCDIVVKKPKEIPPIPFEFTTELTVGGCLVAAAVAFICYTCCMSKKPKNQPFGEIKALNIPHVE
ncbi:unnamed protein product, partial [Candidula unifasciata]